MIETKTYYKCIKHEINDDSQRKETYNSTKNTHSRIDKHIILNKLNLGYLLTRMESVNHKNT